MAKQLPAAAGATQKAKGARQGPGINAVDPVDPVARRRGSSVAGLRLHRRQSSIAGTLTRIEIEGPGNYGTVEQWCWGGAQGLGPSSGLEDCAWGSNRNNVAPDGYDGSNASPTASTTRRPPSWGKLFRRSVSKGEGAHSDKVFHFRDGGYESPVCRYGQSRRKRGEMMASCVSERAWMGRWIRRGRPTRATNCWARPVRTPLLRVHEGPSG